MEVYNENTYIIDEENDNSDALSFRDIPIVADDEDEGDAAEGLENDAAFEFEGLETGPPETETLAIFSGEKIVPAPPRPSQNGNEFTRHPRNGLFIRRESFKRSHGVFRSESGDDDDVVSRSGSVRLIGPVGGDRKPLPPPSTPGRHKAVIGVVRIQSKMEMGDIKRRLSRRRSPPPPPVMFPPEISGGGGGAHRNLSYWGLFKPRRSGADLVGPLTKSSFGCIPRV